MINSFLIWWLKTGRYQWSQIRRRLCGKKYLATEMPEVRSLAEIQDCLKKIRWTMDGPFHLFDAISYPQTTWAKKRDDCDGFASLAAELLYRWNPRTNPAFLTIVTRPVRLSHTVCVFRSHEGTFWYFDNEFLRIGNYNSYDDVVSSLKRGTRRIICWDVRAPATFEMIEFTRVR